MTRVYNGYCWHDDAEARILAAVRRVPLRERFRRAVTAVTRWLLRRAAGDD